MAALDEVRFEGKVKDVKKVKELLNKLFEKAEINVEKNKIEIKFQNFDDMFDDSRPMDWVSVFESSEMEEIADLLDGWLEANISFSENEWVEEYVGYGNILMWGAVEEQVYPMVIKNEEKYREKVAEIYEKHLRELEKKITKIKDLLKKLKGGEND